MKKFYIAVQSWDYDEDHRDFRWHFDNAKEAIAFCKSVIAHSKENHEFVGSIQSRTCWYVQEHLMCSTNDEAWEHAVSITDDSYVTPKFTDSICWGILRVVWKAEPKSTASSETWEEWFANEVDGGTWEYEFTEDEREGG